MDPLLWGPCFWKTLFSISFNCKTSDLPQIVKLLKTLEKVIPCPTCRAHYLINRDQADKLFPLKKSHENVPFWLWHVKSLINKNLKTPNTEFKYIKLRYDTFGHNICDTELADVLVMISMVIVKDEEKKKFHEFLFELGNLTSSFLQGALPSLLLCIDDISPSSLLRICNILRNSYSMKSRELKHYKPAIN